jgi:hypothetical protein
MPLKAHAVTERGWRVDGSQEESEEKGQEKSEEEVVFIYTVSLQWDPPGASTPPANLESSLDKCMEQVERGALTA